MAKNWYKQFLASKGKVLKRKAKLEKIIAAAVDAQVELDDINKALGDTATIQRAGGKRPAKANKQVAAAQKARWALAKKIHHRPENKSKSLIECDKIRKQEAEATKKTATTK